MSSRGSGTYGIDWLGWRKFRKAGMNCPRCGAPMIVRTTYYECSSCHHAVPKPSRRRQTERFAADDFEQQVRESLEAALPEATAPGFMSFELPSQLNFERRALAFLPFLALFIGDEAVRAASHGTSVGMKIGQPVPPGFWLEFGLLGLVLFGLLALYTAIPPFKEITALLFALCAGAVLAIPALSGATVEDYYAVGPNLDVSSMWAVVLTVVYCVWAASFLLREARLMRQ